MRRPALAALLALALPASAAETKSRFSLLNLKVDGAVDEVVPADLDGDGRLDLLVTFKTGFTPNEVRFFAVFWNQDGHFSTKPDLVVPADPETCAFDAGDVDGQLGDELLLITPKGVQVRSLKGRDWGTPLSFVTEPTFFEQPGRGELPHVRIVHDLFAPGSHDLLIPGSGHLSAYKRSGAAFTLAGRLEIPIDSSFMAHGFGHAPGLPGFRLRYEYPTVVTADFDGDGKADVFVSLEDRLAVFRQQADATFHPFPSFQRNFGIRTKEELSDARHQAGISVSDIDGDGVADVIVRKQVEHGLASALATTFAFFGQKSGGYADKPDQVIKNQGASGTEIELVDLTGDGHPDLVVPSVNIGVIAIIRVLTTKTLKVTFQIFPFDPAKRRFAEKPSAERDLKFNLSLSGEADLEAVDERGDYNGDRRPDLLFGTGENELSIFPGITGSEPFAGDAIETIPVRAYGVAQPIDLNRQGKCDVLLSYPRTKDHRGEIAVLLNRGPW